LAPAKKTLDNKVYGTKNKKFQARNHKKPTDVYETFFCVLKIITGYPGLCLATIM
jgi:hypothetical protein